MPVNLSVSSINKIDDFAFSESILSFIYCSFICSSKSISKSRYSSSLSSENFALSSSVRFLCSISVIESVPLNQMKLYFFSSQISCFCSQSLEISFDLPAAAFPYIITGLTFEIYVSDSFSYFLFLSLNIRL